tara:strand:- start:17026 stop:17391 length:366 start_codon:yes stop_codon:yes gene_type:complete
MSVSKIITLLIRQPPYGSSSAKAALDMALSAAVFEQQVQLIFVDDGVFQLLPDQAPQAILAKNTSAALTALPLYGIDTIYADDTSLAQRNIDRDALPALVRRINQQEISRLIHDSDVVLTL